MKLVRPYGRSVTNFEASDLKRKLLLKDSVSEPAGFETLGENDAYTLATWISVIDKVAVKPTGQTKPTPKQREFRERLGNSAWEFISSKNLLPPEMKKVFAAKLHPYPDEDLVGDANEKRTQKKGRWFRTFFGEASIFDADVGNFGQMVFDHLYKNAKRIHADSQPRRVGLVEQRTASLASSAPKPPKEKGADAKRDVAKENRQKTINAPLWNEQDAKSRYCKHNNLPREIYELAMKLQKQKRPLLNRHVGPVLFEHFGKLFRTQGGKVMTRLEIRKNGQAGLLDYHDAVKDTYRRILSGHKARNSGSDDRLLKILPRTPDELFARVMAGRRNLNAGGLIRLGKVAHYAFSGTGALDSVKTSVANWKPDEINESQYYWTSDGQSEIKRNEALIRVWRSILASAAVTLTDWINPDPQPQGDPLIAPAFRSMLEQFDEDHFDQKSRLLFGGASADLNRLERDQKMQVLKVLRDDLYDLRNAAFHFKGRSDFASKLAKIGRGNRAERFLPMYRSDSNKQGERYLRDLRGAEIEFFAKQHQIDWLLNALKRQPDARAEFPPQPRLKRLLKRANNTWKAKEERLGNLPLPPNQRSLDASPALRCRYVCTKLLFDRVFPNWFNSVSVDKLNHWKEIAIDRTTNAARSISKDKSAVAKAVKELNFGADGLSSPIDLLACVSAATATEIRVQKGYDPDPASARKKSKYLDDVVLDIFSLAFNDFLDHPNLKWLTDLSDRDAKPARPISSVPETLLLSNVSTQEPNNWEVALYSILHLVSTAEVSQLLHHLKKWDVLSTPKKSGSKSVQAEDKQVGEVMNVLRLYLDMADDKFEGSDGIDLGDTLRLLFNPTELFDEVYPAKSLFNDDRIPLRGLREACRFGNLAYQADFHRALPIDKGFVDGLDWMERGGSQSNVAKAQKCRTELHERWVENGCSLNPGEAEEYKKAIRIIAKHREVSAHVRFVNHIKLHRLIMRLLGRFADFAGLFERDLYFATLGLLIELGLAPNDAFAKPGLQNLKEGQIIDALKNSTDEQLLKKINLYFGTNFEPKSPDQKMPTESALIEIRNRMQHLSMLFGSGGEQTTPGNLTMTELVNQLRKLLAYDRKLKNAVSKSVIGILEREKLKITWQMGAGKGKQHDLAKAKIATQQAFHIKLRNSNSSKVPENLNTVAFTKMVAEIFGGEVEPVHDVTAKGR